MGPTFGGEKLGVYWHYKMIFVGSMSKAYMQTKTDVNFVFWLSLPAIDRWRENAGSVCSGSSTRITNASYLLVFSLWETIEKAVTVC